MYTLKKKGFVSALPASGKILWEKKKPNTCSVAGDGLFGGLAFIL